MPTKSYSYLLIAILLQTLNSYSQFSNGTITFSLGSQLSYDGSQTSGNKYYNSVFSIESGLSKFTSDNSFLGLNGGLRFEIDKYNSTSFVARNLFISGQIRRYLPLTDRSFGFMLTNNTIMGSTFNYTNYFSQTYLRINLKPGIYIFLSPKLLFEFSFAEAYLETRSKSVKNYGLGILDKSTFCDFNVRYILNSLPQKRF